MALGIDGWKIIIFGAEILKLGNCPLLVDALLM